MRPAMEIHSKAVKMRHSSADSHHRHMLCLYGDDERLLRFTALKLNMSVSHLIRFALEWFLPILEEARIEQEWFSSGQKARQKFSLLSQGIDTVTLQKRWREIKVKRIERPYARRIYLDNFFWYGIKLTPRLILDRVCEQHMITFDRIFYSRFAREEWFSLWPGMEHSNKILFGLA